MKPGFGASYHYHVAGLLADADPRLTRPRQEEILALPSFDEHHREKLARRWKLLNWDEPAMWRELEAVSENSLEAEHIGQTRYHEGVDVVEAMTRQGVRDIERILHHRGAGAHPQRRGRAALRRTAGG